MRTTDPEPENDLKSALARRYGGDRWFLEEAFYLLGALDRLYAERTSQDSSLPTTNRRRAVLSTAQTVTLSVLAALGALVGVLVGALLAVRYGLCP